MSDAIKDAVEAQVAKIMADAKAAGRPSVGRIVHYAPRHSPDECYAALVTFVYGRSDRVDLTIFGPGTLSFAEEVGWAEGKGHLIAGTWHWPERVD